MGNAGSQALGGSQLRKAKRALHKLVALSPAFRAGKLPLSPQEFFSRAGVLAIIGMQTSSFREPENIDGAYIRFSACEVEDYFRSTMAN